MKNIEFDTLACIHNKLELVSVPKNQAKVMVLEPNPNSIYNQQNNIVCSQKPNSKHFYIPVKYEQYCFQDLILRNASSIMEKYLSVENIHPGQLNLFNQNYQCIRIVSTDPEILPYLISDFLDRGIQFLSQNNVRSYLSYIYYKKHIELKIIDKGIYLDSNEAGRYYFGVPKSMHFDAFIEGLEKIMITVNIPCSAPLLMYLYNKKRMLDFTGIHLTYNDPEFLKNIQASLNALFEIEKAEIKQ